MFSHSCRQRPKTKLTKALTYRSCLSLGSRVKKHQEVQVVKATRNSRENYLKWMLTQLLYARGNAQRTDYKDKNKTKQKNRIKRYRYVRGWDVNTIINLLMTVKRSCHWAEGTTQGDPIAVALFVLSVQPMIRCLQVASTAKQSWFPNDACGTGYTTEMR